MNRVENCRNCNASLHYAAIHLTQLYCNATLCHNPFARCICRRDKQQLKPDPTNKIRTKPKNWLNISVDCQMAPPSKCNFTNVNLSNLNKHSRDAQSRLREMVLQLPAINNSRPIAIMASRYLVFICHRHCAPYTTSRMQPRLQEPNACADETKLNWVIKIYSRTIFEFMY